MKDVLIRDMEEDLYNLISESAEKDKRSINKQIQHLLEIALNFNK
jgi:hypothetical protein